MKSVDKIANSVFQRRDEYVARRKRRQMIFRRISVVIPVCLIVVLMLTTFGTCYAFAVSFGVADDYLNFFKGQSGIELSVAQQKEEAVAEVGESITCNGVTVTAKSAYADGSMAYVLVDVEAPETVSIDTLQGLGFDFAGRELVRGENPERFLNINDLRVEFKKVPDYDKMENTASFMIRVDSIRLPGSKFSFADGYTRTLILDTLSAYKETYPYSKYTIADGTWKFNIDFVDVSQGEVELLSNPVQMRAVRSCSNDCMTAIVKSISVGSLGLTLDYDVKAGEMPEPGDFGPIKIQLKDGTVIAAHLGMSTSLGNEYGSDYTCSYIAESPIIFSDVDCVIINDEVKIPFNSIDK